MWEKKETISLKMGSIIYRKRHDLITIIKWSFKEKEGISAWNHMVGSFSTNYMRAITHTTFEIKCK